MHQSPYPPLFLSPSYQSYVWGGDRILRHFHRDEPPGVYAESWEVSDRPEGPCQVSRGPWAGRTLASLLAEDPEGVLGEAAGPGGRFPLLIKLIDARETLSVQVHPDDASAARLGGEAKTEMWYVLEAAEEAAVYAGFREPMTPERFRQAVAEEVLEEALRRIPVRPGDAIFMPGGRVHAIGAGCLLLEIQQNSNTTYRIYDWGRMGADGAPRPLHLGEAEAVIDWREQEDARVAPDAPREIPGGVCQEVLHSPYFRLDRLLLDGRWQVPQAGAATWEVFFLAEGEGRLHTEDGVEEVSAGQTVLFPAHRQEATWDLSREGGALMRIRPGKRPAAG